MLILQNCHVRMITGHRHPEHTNGEQLAGKSKQKVIIEVGQLRY